MSKPIPSTAQQRSWLNVLKPSSTGVVIYIVLSLAVIAGQNLSSVKHYLKVPDNARLNPFGYVYDRLVQLLGVGRSNSLAEIIFWSVIGLVVYVVVVETVHVAHEFENDVAEAHYLRPQRSDSASPVKDFAKRLGFHVGFLAIFLYYAYFLTAVVFGGRTQAWINHNYWLNLHNSVTLVILFLIECVALHIATILLRLLFLRRRLFG
jgi:hypothetical protein